MWRLVLMAAVVGVGFGRALGQVAMVVNGNVLVVNGNAAAGNANNEPELPTVFVVPKADTKTIDKLDDFDRYVGKKAWELAFRTMNQVEGDAKGMVPGSAESGASRNFLFPATLRVKQSLLHLPPEGRDAYRLFNDASARALWDKLSDQKTPRVSPVPADEAASLRKIVNQYFLTSVGDLAADRLADALFEQGNFAAAASLWRSVVEDYPDPHVQAARVQVKRCVALARLGRRDELAALVSTVKEQYAGQQVTVGGKSVDAAEFAGTLAVDERTTQPTTAPATMPGAQGVNVVLSDDTPLWQVRVTKASVLAQMQQQVQGYWGMDIHFDGSTPTAALDDKRLYVNWFGVVYAVDLQTGKMVWRTSKFSDLTSRASMFAQYGVNPDHFDISVVNGKVIALRSDPNKMSRGEGGSYQLECFDGATGKSLWSATGIGTALMAPYVPATGGTTGFLATIASDQNMTLTAMNVETGKSEWNVPLGKPQGAQNNYGGGQMYPIPSVTSANGMVYVGTNNGAMLAVSIAERRVEWAFHNETKPVLGERMYWQPGPRSFETPVTLFAEGGLVYLKDSSASTLYAIEPESPDLKWRRKLSPEEMVVGLKGQTAFVLGKDLSAMDMKTKQLLWSTKIPVLTGLIQPLMADGHIYVASQRGIFDVDPANGDVLHIFRGADRESSGGRLYVAHAGDANELICVTDGAVTAYPMEHSGK